jgi:trans-aconitate 2-methyltransferase
VEWDAGTYRDISAMQKAFADEALGGLALRGDERVLDVGCGDGRITAEIARRLERGEVVGLDASENMVSMAARSFPGIRFVHADARDIPFVAEFDQVVSFNALHWVREQDAALRAIHRALRPGGRAHLQMVGHGPAHSMVHAFVEASRSAAWSGCFEGVEESYFHASPGAYRRLAEEVGLAVEEVSMPVYRWDFGSDEALARFADVTFVEWTRHVPQPSRLDFIHDALARYREQYPPADANVYTINQLKAMLRRP